MYTVPLGYITKGLTETSTFIQWNWRINTITIISNIDLKFYSFCTSPVILTFTCITENTLGVITLAIVETHL